MDPSCRAHGPVVTGLRGRGRPIDPARARFNRRLGCSDRGERLPYAVSLASGDHPPVVRHLASGREFARRLYQPSLKPSGWSYGRHLTALRSSCLRVSFRIRSHDHVAYPEDRY